MGILPTTFPTPTKTKSDSALAASRLAQVLCLKPEAKAGLRSTKSSLTKVESLLAQVFGLKT
jgi:hypothetical protein